MANLKKRYKPNRENWTCGPPKGNPCRVKGCGHTSRKHRDTPWAEGPQLPRPERIGALDDIVAKATE